MSKESDFKKEYDELLAKYNVSLRLESFRDEWGIHNKILIKEKGSYCNINYSPSFVSEDKAYRGMGG